MFCDPELVLPSGLFFADIPLLVSNTDCAIVAVPFVFVYAVVENVTVLISGSAVRNTSAKAGAGTGMRQVFALVSHAIDTTFKSPWKRPSTLCIVPSV